MILNTYRSTSCLSKVFRFAYQLSSNKNYQHILNNDYLVQTFVIPSYQGILALVKNKPNKC